MCVCVEYCPGLDLGFGNLVNLFKSGKSGELLFCKVNLVSTFPDLEVVFQMVKYFSEEIHPRSFI